MFNPVKKPENELQGSESSENQPKIPSISLPKGGGAIRGIGEKFAANPVTGTGSLSVPIFTSPGRSGFGPQLSLSYDSGAGNGPFGFGWSLSLPSITRKTDKGLPKYQDAAESDVFILSGAEDLVPAEETVQSRTTDNTTYGIKLYRPRIEGLFARIERWADKKTGDVHWRSISKDNILTVYGRDKKSRIYDPADESRIFSWLICESYDDKGNAIVYEYLAENNDKIDISQANERNRIRTANQYIKRIKYGNRKPLMLDTSKPSFRKTHTEQIDFSSADWMFELVFDYDEGHYELLPLDEKMSMAEQHQFVQASSSANGKWSLRPDPFSVYRAGFEVRTYRLCQRVLMFHYFEELASEKVDENPELIILPYLVRSTEFDYSDLDYSEQFDTEKELKYKSTNCFSFIRAVIQSGYVRDDSQQVIEKNGIKYLKFIKKSLPPLVFEYSQANIDYKIYDIDDESLENMPYGLDGAHYQWVDLDGEGISGILSEQAGTWYYKRNNSPISILTDELGKPVKNEYGDLRVRAEFGPLEILKSMPSLANLSGGRQQLLDLAGDGQLDLAEFNSSTPGFYERTEDQQWKQFTPFTSLPNIDWNNPNLKFLDLTGDGHADIIITENEVFTWYESLAEAGFSPCERVLQALDEEKGPRLVFSDGTQSIYLADMSGDGLIDLVRIRNNEVCYWPNLGYGLFGSRVTMDNSPLFDSQDQFNQQRIRLADIDGSGTTDIIYLKSDGVHVYFNQSGNSWTELEPRIPFPQVDNLTSVMTADLLGNGTACLVWSSALPGHSRQQMRYIDLMGGQKPHLMVRTKNNLGAETRVHYAPSTKFYLEDQKAGKPWITHIPFPVHVVERVETYDRISRNRFVTRYAYHHGYFDGVEREFRGFGMVEQWDTEELNVLSTSEILPSATNISQVSHIPPVLTRTWFHTGAYIEGRNISRQLEEEYYRESDLSQAVPGLNEKQLGDMLLEDTVPLNTIFAIDDTRVPFFVSNEEEREACRSLKGSILRQEVYALDGTDKEDRPYSVSERNYTIELLQTQGPNKHAVFFSHPRETIDFHYERELYEINGLKLADPRVSHAMTLEVDKFGNVLKSVAIGYGRRHDEPDKLLTDDDKKKQKSMLVTYTESSYTNPIDQENAYRTPLPYEIRTYELLKVTPASNEPPVTNLFRFDEMLSKIKNASDGKHDIPYEDIDAVGAREDSPYRRLIEHVRTYYRKNDLTGRLLPKELESLALPYESYKLAFTPDLLAKVYGNRVTDTILANEGKYGHSEGDNNWWIPSGQVFYSPKENDTPDNELTFACKHFFLPHRFCDPFGNNSIVFYDSSETDSSKNYNLLLKETHDALGNTATAENDYRMLQPKLMTDPNGNRSAAVFDVLGMVAGAVVMGKVQEPDGKQKGDTLEGFKADITLQEIQAFIANPRNSAPNLLKGATSRIIYDINRFLRCGQPSFAATLTREIHRNDQGGDKSPIQISVAYSDGFGREIQTKIQAESGDAPQRGSDEILPSSDIKPSKLVLENGKPKQSHADNRWVGKGRTVYNNKGKPVKQYEPFFSSTHLYEEEPEMTDTGVTPILFYDPVGRVVATLHPNHTYEKVVFDPWYQQTYDVNDTVLIADPKIDPDVGSFFSRLPDRDYLPTWYAQRQGGELGEHEKVAATKTAVHADTPTTAYFDSLGRIFLTIAHNQFQRNKPCDVVPDDPPTEEFHSTSVIYDIEGNQRAVIDALDRTVMRYDYDMLGNPSKQDSMDAGIRWMLSNVTGNPIYGWDSRGHRIHHLYDQLRRQTHLFVQHESNPEDEKLAERTIYGEIHPDSNSLSAGTPAPLTLNLRGKVFLQLDSAGAVINCAKSPKNDADPDAQEFEAYDFEGNLLCSTRMIAKEYHECPDWKDIEDKLNTYIRDKTFLEADALNAFLLDLYSLQEPAEFTNSTTYDALNRPVTLTTPDNSVISPIYNEANLLESLSAKLRGKDSRKFIKNIDYNAKGQRELIEYGNDVITEYEYDPQTFRLINLFTTRGTQFPTDCSSQEHCSKPPKDCPKPRKQVCGVQNLHYTYDPSGNITHIRDDAQQTIYFSGSIIQPESDYTYDAIYRLIEAKGREHIGSAETPWPTWDDRNRTNLPQPGNPEQMRNYVEKYFYDSVGNFDGIKHWACNGEGKNQNNWTRTFTIDSDPSDPNKKQSNRLTECKVGNQTGTFTYDSHGNMTFMSHLPTMTWDFKDQLRWVEKNKRNDETSGCKVYFTYDASGQRVRKVMEQDGKILNERIYIGGYEIYRKYKNDNKDPMSILVLERESLHIMDDKQRIALIDTKTIDKDNPETELPETLIRYQFGNHLGSAALELDENANVISYEEYYPYGSTSYQAVRSNNHGSVEVSTKRYRYTGKERDEETGFYYHGERYYAPWLGRWASADSSGLIDGTNLYDYVNNNPVMLFDPSGLAGQSVDPKMLAEKEVRDAAFEAGKELERGKEQVKRKGKKLPPPTGKTLEKLAGNSKEAKKLRQRYAAKQGSVAGKILLKNLTERSEAAARGEGGKGHFGEASQKLVPELGFYKKKIITVGQEPGGQPKDARTADMGIAHNPTSPSKWGSLKSQKGSEPFSEALDMKLGEGKVEKKAAFKKQSGGLNITEIYPYTPGLKEKQWAGGFFNGLDAAFDAWGQVSLNYAFKLGHQDPIYLSKGEMNSMILSGYELVEHKLAPKGCVWKRIECKDLSCRPLDYPRPKYIIPGFTEDGQRMRWWLGRPTWLEEKE